MPTVSIASPNPENYVIGKGRVFFQPSGAPGDIEDYPVGSAPEFELTPDVKKLDHFSPMAGVKSKDKSVITERGYKVRMVMEEWTPSNMRLMLAGNPDTSNLAAVTINIGEENNVTGRLLFVGSNAVGPKWTFDLPEVEFSPSGSLNPISDEWGSMEVTGDVLVQDDGTFGIAMSDFSAGALAPTNSVPPTIYGVFTVGQTVHAIKGVWTGSPTNYTYQWQRDAGAGFVNIAGATAKDYLIAAPVVAGNPIRCRVTAFNVVGSTTADSPSSADVT